MSTKKVALEECNLLEFDRFAPCYDWESSMSRDVASQSSPARAVVKNEPTDKISTKAAGKRKASAEPEAKDDEAMQEDEEAASVNEEEEEAGSPSRKRARNGNSQEEEEEDGDDDSDPGDPAELFLRDIPLARDQNGLVSLSSKYFVSPLTALLCDSYVTGSIVRIACHNFVTYTSVEFFPGPDLNMIIGPNGTGKSTIACAIAIGLGFPTSVRTVLLSHVSVAHHVYKQVLGRQSKISGFVKNGAATGWVEIELKGKVGKKNSTIRRNIQVSDEKSTFKLDGKLYRLPL